MSYIYHENNKKLEDLRVAVDEALMEYLEACGLSHELLMELDYSEFDEAISELERTQERE